MFAVSLADPFETFGWINLTYILRTHVRYSQRQFIEIQSSCGQNYMYAETLPFIFLTFHISLPILIKRDMYDTLGKRVLFRRCIVLKFFFVLNSHRTLFGWMEYRCSMIMRQDISATFATAFKTHRQGKQLIIIFYFFYELPLFNQLPLALSYFPIIHFCINF